MVATLPREALALADLQSKIAHMAAQEGEDAAPLVGTPEGARHLARLSMAREISEVIGTRIAALTVAGEGAPPEEPS